MMRTPLAIATGLLVALLLLLSGCDQSPQPSSAPLGGVVGQLATDFTLTDIQGNRVTLSQFRGKVVLLNFWATWCPPCVEEMPSMEQLHRKFKNQEFVLLAVNVEENGGEAVRRFLQKTPYSFPILIDSDARVQNTYKVFRFPETFVIDRNGKIVEKIIGGRNWMSGKTFDLINFLVNG